MNKRLPESYKWYSDACKMYGYPAHPYGKAIEALVERDDAVLDLGCGIGAASLMVAPRCKSVIALDQDMEALKHLEAEAEKLGVTNIETVCGSWPACAPARADVVLVLHVRNMMKTQENLKLIYESAARGGFIACHASFSREQRPFAELIEALGNAADFRLDSCENGCFARGVLEALGARVECERFKYDLGQPLDTLDEAFRFLCRQAGAEGPSVRTVEKYIARYVTAVGDRFLVPIERHSCGMAFARP